MGLRLLLFISHLIPDFWISAHISNLFMDSDKSGVVFIDSWSTNQTFCKQD